MYTLWMIKEKQKELVRQRSGGWRYDCAEKNIFDC